MNAIAAQQAGLLEQLRQIASTLDAMPHTARSAFVCEQSVTLNISKQTLYRWLKQKVGWSSGRKKREDAGYSSMSSEALLQVAAMQKVSIRKNDKLILPETVAVSIAKQNGIEVPVSVSQVRRLKRLQGISPRKQAIATPHVNMRSLHPNHTHQVDPSLCVLYYMNGKQQMMTDDKFYKNKWENYGKIKLKVWRYVLVDHASSTIIPWYVESAGENPTILSEFLFFAWRQQPGRDFHGVPLNMIWDKGSANTAASIKNLLDGLEVNHIAHTAGNARAKGSVEGANQIVETQFESRLKFQPVNSVEELNASVFAWANTYNANCVPGQDCRLHRRGLPTPMARSDLWQYITAEQIRLLPDEDICRDFMRGQAVSRKVRPDLTVTFKHPQAESSQLYDLTGCDAVNVGEKVDIQPMVYGNQAIVVTVNRHNDEPLQHKLEPIQNYDRFGFRDNAAVFGEEHKSKPKTDVEWAADLLNQTAYGDLNQKDMEKAKQKAVPFAGALDTHGHLKQVELPHYLPRQGSTINTGQRFDEKPMSAIAAAKVLKAELGTSYNTFHLNYVKQQFPDGITNTELDALVLQFKQQAVLPALKRVK